MDGSFMTELEADGETFFCVAALSPCVNITAQGECDTMSRRGGWLATAPFELLTS